MKRTKRTKSASTGWGGERDKQQNNTRKEANTHWGRGTLVFAMSQEQLRRAGLYAGRAWSLATFPHISSLVAEVLGFLSSFLAGQVSTGTCRGTSGAAGLVEGVPPAQTTQLWNLFKVQHHALLSPCDALPCYCTWLLCQTSPSKIILLLLYGALHPGT